MHALPREFMISNISGKHVRLPHFQHRPHDRPVTGPTPGSPDSRMLEDALCLSTTSLTPSSSSAITHCTLYNEIMRVITPVSFVCFVFTSSHPSVLPPIHTDPQKGPLTTTSQSHIDGGSRQQCGTLARARRQPGIAEAAHRSPELGRAMEDEVRWPGSHMSRAHLLAVAMTRR